MASQLWRTAGYALAGLVGLIAGCGVTPARSNVPATPARPLSGEYVATFHTQFVGPIRARMVAEPTEKGFKANTPPGVAWGLVGGVEKLLGPLFAPFVFPSGMILTWESGVPRGDAPGEGTIGVGSLESLRARTRVTSQGAPVEVRWRDGRLIGLVDLKPLAASPSFADYPALVAKAREEFPRHYFDPELAQSRQVRSYFEDLGSVADKANDDVEFLFGAVFAGRKNIARYGTPLVFPKEVPESDALFAGKADSPKPYAISGDLALETVTLRIDAFVDDAMVDEGFRAALSTKPKALILDLRTCPGIELSAFRAAGWLVNSPLPAGTYVGSARRRLITGSDERPVTEVRIGEQTSSSAFASQLATEQALHFEILPRPDGFAGPVVLLTSRRTSSTTEALIAVLAAAGRVSVVGEPTAGRPMLSREFDLGQGWAMRIAAYDFITPDGTRIGRAGVEPTLRVGREEAPKAARDWIARVLGKVGTAIGR